MKKSSLSSAIVEMKKKEPFVCQFFNVKIETKTNRKSELLDFFVNMLPVFSVIKNRVKEWNLISTLIIAICFKIMKKFLPVFCALRIVLILYYIDSKYKFLFIHFYSTHFV